MPLYPESHDDAVNAIAALLPTGSTFRLYSQLADPSTGPDPADELTGAGYTPFVSSSAFSTSTGGDGLASLEVDFGTSTDAYDEDGLAWSGEDPDGVMRYFDLLQDPVDDVDDADVAVVRTVDIYLGRDGV